MPEGDPSPAGEKREEVNSELTEMLKMERLAAEATSEKQAVKAVDMLIVKIRVHIKNISEKDNDAETMNAMKEIDKLYQHFTVEQVRSQTMILNGTLTIELRIANDPDTRMKVPFTNFKDAYDVMVEHAYARLYAKRMEWFQALKELISDEFDLKENLAKDVFSLKKLDRMISRSAEESLHG